MKDHLFFYRLKETWGCFSNFARTPIVVYTLEWATTEHFFQAYKFLKTDHEWAAEIRAAATPGKAAKEGRSRAHPLDPRWEEIKDDVMRLALLEKFTQHEDCRDTLLATGDKMLVEHTVNDTYWADGTNEDAPGPGRNMLGYLLVELRTVLRCGEEATRNHRTAVEGRLRETA